jgi:hypothetical protein
MIASVWLCEPCALIFSTVTFVRQLRTWLGRTAQRNQEPSCDLFQDSQLSVQERSRIQQRREDIHEVSVMTVMSHTPHAHEGPEAANVGTGDVSGLPQCERAAQLQTEARVTKPEGSPSLWPCSPTRHVDDIPERS